MRLIAFETGRTSLLFPLEEINPLVPVDSRQLVEGIAGRYSFRGFPPPSMPREELAKNGAKFENGLLTLDGKLINIIDFTAFNDGIVVNSNTTEGASAFVDDLLVFLRDQFGFRDFISRPQRTFISQVVVEFDRPLSGLLPTFGRIAELIAHQTQQTYGLTARMDFTRLDFELDKVTTHLRYIIPRFIIERRPGVPFSQERYFCSAPMHTRSHLGLLEEIERMVPAK
jgi:hypothetical protein